jgi:hypothetical protein
MRKSHALLVSLLLAGTAAAPSALGQSPSAAAAGQSQAPAPRFSDAELDAFAHAALTVQKINAEYELKMQLTGTQQEQQELMLEASLRKNAAVTNNGLNAEKYQQIIEQIDTNPGFANQVLERIKAIEAG